MHYIKQIESYKPKNEQERRDQQTILAFIKNNPDVLQRENHVAHLTSSAIVVNKSMDKVLFAYHKIYNAWSWVGGHNDGDDDLLRVAINETQEETGVKNVHPYSEDIFMIDIIHVSNHHKNGDFIGDHLHLNVTFLLIADEKDDLQINHAENTDVRWFLIDEVLDHVNEERMIPIYQKAFDAIQKLKESDKNQ